MRDASMRWIQIILAGLLSDELCVISSVKDSLLGY
jgi:hypothetical protein